MNQFENQAVRMKKIDLFLEQYGLESKEEALKICETHNINVREMVYGIQPIAFNDAIWAYTLGIAAAISSNCTSAAEATIPIGNALQAFTIPGSVAETRKVGVGHGALAARLLNEQTECFAIIAGHESWAAAEGALGIANAANKVRSVPLRVILVGLGKDAGYIMARMNGFTYFPTQFDHCANSLTVGDALVFSQSSRSLVRLYACSSAQEAVAVMIHEGVDVSITGNTANAVRFQHLVAGQYKKWTKDNERSYFSVASGGGTGRTMHPDNLGVGAACYGITDSLGRVHGDVQFAGSSSVPAHVEMMGMIGMGNNPIVAATVQSAVSVAHALSGDKAP